MSLDRLATHMRACEGNFHHYYQDRIRRLGADSVNNQKVSYGRLMR